MNRHRRPRTRNGAREEGIAAAWLAVVAAVLVLMTALAIDLGGIVRAQQQVRDAAAQAARAAGQQLDATAVATGTGLAADPAPAAAAARSYLAAAGVTGTVTVTGATLRVDTSDTVHGHLLAISTTVTGTAQVRLARSIQGVEQ